MPLPIVTNQRKQQDMVFSFMDVFIIIMFKRIHGALPSYLNEHIPINNSRHSRTTRYSNFNVLCPRYNRETEGGRTFLVTGTKIWNEIPLRIRMADSIRCFKHNMWTNIFSQQQFLSHFRVQFPFQFLYLSCNYIILYQFLFLYCIILVFIL